MGRSMYCQLSNTIYEMMVKIVNSAKSKKIWFDTAMAWIVAVGLIVTH